MVDLFGWKLLVLLLHQGYEYKSGNLIHPPHIQFDVFNVPNKLELSIPRSKALKEVTRDLEGERGQVCFTCEADQDPHFPLKRSTCVKLPKCSIPSALVEKIWEHEPLFLPCNWLSLLLFLVLPVQYQNWSCLETPREPIHHCPAEHSCSFSTSKTPKIFGTSCSSCGVWKLLITQNKAPPPHPSKWGLLTEKTQEGTNTFVSRKWGRAGRRREKHRGRCCYF